MISKNAGNIIEKGRLEGVTQITKSDRTALITLVHDYLREKCVKYNRTQIATVAKLLVFLVPKLQDNTQGEHAGYVSST